MDVRRREKRARARSMCCISGASAETLTLNRIYSAAASFDRRIVCFFAKRDTDKSEAYILNTYSRTL